MKPHNKIAKVITETIARLFFLKLVLDYHVTTTKVCHCGYGNDEHLQNAPKREDFVQGEVSCHILKTNLVFCMSPVLKKQSDDIA